MGDSLRVPACPEQPAAIVTMRRGLIGSEEEGAAEVPFRLGVVPQSAMGNRGVDLEQVIGGSIDLRPRRAVERPTVVPFRHPRQAVVHPAAPIVGTLARDIEPQGLFRTPYLVAAPGSGRRRHQRETDGGDGGAAEGRAHPRHQQPPGFEYSRHETHECEVHAVVIRGFGKRREGGGQQGNEKPGEAIADGPRGRPARGQYDDRQQRRNK